MPQESKVIQQLIPKIKRISQKIIFRERLLLHTIPRFPSIRSK